MPVIFDDNHYCILAINVLEVAKEVPIAYIYITKSFCTGPRQFKHAITCSIHH